MGLFVNPNVRITCQPAAQLLIERELVLSYLFYMTPQRSVRVEQGERRKVMMLTGLAFA